MDVEGRNSAFLAERFPALSFQNQVDKFNPQPTEDSDNVLFVYLVRNILWNCSDEDCVKIIQTFVPAMKKSPDTVLLVNEMMSPAAGTFECHVEKAYRRRDVTVMTMHNAKQRTEEEWKALFAKASPNFTVGTILPFRPIARLAEHCSSTSKQPPQLTAIEAFGKCVPISLTRFAPARMLIFDWALW